MKKLFRGLVAFITVTLITQVAGTFVLDHSLFSSKFILAQANSGDFYQQFATAIPQFMHQSSDENTRKQAELIAQVVTPSYIRTKFSSYVTQLEARYRNNGPRPTLDFTDLARVAKKKGVKIPKQALSHPVKLGDPVDPQKISFLFKNIKTVEYAGSAGILLMLLVTAYLAEEGKKLSKLARTFGWAAFWLLPNGLVFRAIPDLAGSLIDNNRDIAAIAPVLKSLIKALSIGVSNRYLMAAGVLAAAGVVFVLAHFVSKLFFRKPKKTEKSAKPSKKSKKDEGGLIPQS